MATATLLDPKENYIGNTVMWDGHCPFCRESTCGGRAACGWRGDTSGKVLGIIHEYDVKILAVCTKVAAAPANPFSNPAPAKPANPNGPHNNVIGAKYDRMGGRTGDYCPFCNAKAVGFSFPCGWAGQADSPGSNIGTVLCACKASGRPEDAKPLKLEKIMGQPVLPRINCAACGAYGAEKHRIGCKGGI